MFAAAVDTIDSIVLIGEMKAQRLAGRVIDLLQSILGINTCRVSYKNQFLPALI